MRRFHSPILSRPCGAKAMALRSVGIDRAERDIVGLELERALELGFVMRADAELHPGLADRADIRAVEIVWPRWTHGAPSSIATRQ